MPLSEDALTFARQLAAAKYRFPDDRLAVADLLQRWNLGLGTTIAERRMALRLSREQAAIELTGMKDLNRAMQEFFGHPGQGRGTTAQFGRRVLDCVLSCDVRLVVLDDLHFLKWGQESGIEVSNHLKRIANEFPVTLLMVGVELAEKGLFGEGTNGRDTALAQTGRRTTRLGLRPFTIDEEARRREWRQMLLALEQRIVLTDKHPGMLADDLSDYLFARSTGHIGSLMTLINHGCQRAVRTGAERLDQELMDRVKDEASEAARLELQAALEKKRLTSRPRSRGRRAA